MREREICVAILILACVAGVSSWAGLKVGSTKAQVLEQLGAPIGGGQRRGVEILIYDGGTIDLRGGRVIRFDDDILSKTKAAREAKIFADRQKAKGLVEYNGVWVSPEKKIELERRALQQGNPIEIIENRGAAIDLEALLIPGKFTIIDFYADWSEPCKLLSPKIEEIALRDAEVYVKRIDIAHFKSPVALQFGLETIPSVRIYGRDGRQVGHPTYSAEQVRRTIAEAK